MKKITKLLVLLIFSNSTIHLLAQDLPLMTPDNVVEVTDLIYEQFNGQIEEDYNQVYSFLNSLLPSSSESPAYDENCTPPPSPVIDQVTSIKIAFEWDDTTIPGFSEYKTSFIKLTNLPPNGIPEQGSIYTTDSYVDFNVTDGLMVVAFQSICVATGETTGRVHVIIVDKPVFIQDATAGCQCKKTQLIITKEFQGLPGDAYDAVTVPYTHSGNVGTYVGDIHYSTGHVAEFVTEINILNAGATIEVGLHNNCMTNLFKQGGNSYLNSHTANEGELIQFGNLGFSNGFTFNPVEGISGIMTVRLCSVHGTIGKGEKRKDYADADQQGGLSDSGLDQIVCYPNPAKDNVTFSIPSLAANGSYHYSIIDVYGNTILLPIKSSNISNEKINVNTSTLPAGSYIFLVQGVDKVMKTRFIIMN